MRQPISLWQNRTGTTFIETALSLPLLLLLCFGAMDFARVVFAGTTIAGAARAGVQYGALTPGHSGDLTGMETAALNDAADLGNAVTATATNFCVCRGATVECATSCDKDVPSGYVSVSTKYTFNTLFAYPGVPKQIVLSRTAKMRVQ
jgi:Flp pilus assembly protein TadG